MLHAWANLASRSHSLHIAASRAAKRCLTRRTVNALRAWRVLTTAHRRDARIVARCRVHAQQRTARSALLALRSHTDNMRHARSQATILQAKQYRKVLTAALQGWQLSVEKMRAFCGLLERVQRRLNMSGVRHAFAKWLDFSCEAAAARHHAEQIACRWYAEALASAFSAWAAATTTHRAAAQRAGMLMRRRQECLLHDAFAAWQEQVANQMGKQYRCMRAVQHWLKRVLSGSFTAWQHATLASKRRAHVASAALARQRKRAVMRSLYGWHAAVLQLKQQRVVLASALHTTDGLILVNACSA
jgi:hypothetical protein